MPFNTRSQRAHVFEKADSLTTVGVLRACSNRIGKGSQARRTAALAVRHLTGNPEQRALLLLTWICEIPSPVTFPYEQTFRAAAQRNGFHLAKVSQPILDYFEHYLFLTRSDDLTDEELLTCRSSTYGSSWAS